MEVDAEADATAEARARFAEGVAHTQAERWSEAARAFEAALALRAAAPIRYNLAAAQVELGRYREASEQLEAVDADPTSTPELRELSDALRARIAVAAGRLSIERSAQVSDAAVLLDAEPLSEDWLARQIPVAPGEHVVEAQRDGSSVAHTRVEVAAGEHTQVVLGLMQVGAGPETSAALHEQWWFWVGIGGGALATALIIGIAAGVATADGGQSVVEGNFSPGVIRWD